ncbi:MAG TPA: PqqD family protein [Pyrinomonadaceae bacterium]|nr:PqqD family protein [Pyrinomonadaceae bacterium]
MTNSGFIPLEHIVATQLDDGDGVLVDLNTKQYYQLNETAMLIWRALENGHPFEQIVAEIMRVYTVDDDHAVTSAARLLKEFQKRKLVRLAE